MNQQLIDQLIKLATIRVNNPLVNSDGKVIRDDWEEGVSMSKLIELTVRECIEVVIDGQYSADECRGNTHRIAHNNARDEASSDIKKHFGVQE